METTMARVWKLSRGVKLNQADQDADEDGDVCVPIRRRWLNNEIQCP